MSHSAPMYFKFKSNLNFSKPIDDLIGNRLCLFSYGSGLQASMYSIKINNNGLSQLLHGIHDVAKRLDSRIKVEPREFAKIMSLRQEVHHKGKESSLEFSETDNSCLTINVTFLLTAPYNPVEPIANLFDGTYYLENVDDMHRRKYGRKTCDKINGV